MRALTPTLILILATLATAHPRHEEEAEPTRGIARYILPRDPEDICDHTLAPELADYYGDLGDPDDLRAWIEAQQQARGRSGPGVSHRGKTAYAAQMHIHGSMSEGTGSMETQTYEARNAGVDILWWSDHDHRMSYHHHVSTFGFEGWCEFWAANEPWTPTLQFELTKYKSINRPLPTDELPYPCTVNYTPQEFDAAEAGFSEEHAIEGQRSLRLDATARAADQNHRQWLWQFYSDGRQSWRRALASDVTLHIAILPTVIGPDARPVIRVELSDHLFAAPPGGPLPFEFRQLAITYYLSNTDTQPTLVDHEYRVPLPFVRDWNEYELRLTDDVRAAFEFITGEKAFPYLEAGDNSAHRIFFGMEARAGARGEAYFDALRIDDLIRGDALLDEQRAMAARFQSRVPEVHQLHATELSLTAPQHLTEFSRDLVLPDYEELARTSPFWDEGLGMVGDQSAYKEWLFAELVRRAHARGGVVSYNHMWGGGLNTLSNQQMVDRLLANNAYGCDILEVGYRSRHAHDLPDYLWVWDELQKAGMYILGNGTSDLHGPTPGQWLTHGQNLITWIYSDSLDETDLLDGLRAGRLYFGDPRLFPEGMLDLTSDRGHRMGQIVLTDRSEAAVTLELHGAMSNDEVRVVIDGEVASTHAAAAFTPLLELPPFAISDGRGSFVRFELYRINGQDKGFSNHLHFVRELPEEGVDAARAAFDIGDVYTLDMAALTLMDATLSTSCGATTLTIHLHTRDALGATGTEGWIMLDTGSRGLPDAITFAPGLSGASTSSGALLTLDALTGDGRVTLTWGCEGDLTADGRVDFNDLNVVLNEWGASGVACELTGDGQMGFDDLNVVLAAFGSECE